MVQWLRILIALPQSPGLVTKNHMTPHSFRRQNCNSSFSRSESLRHTCRQTVSVSLKKKKKPHISKYASPSKFLGLHKHSIKTLQLPLTYAIKMRIYIHTEMPTRMYMAVIFLAIKHCMSHFICTCFFLGSEEAHPSSPLSSSETCLSEKTVSLSPASSPVLSYSNGLDLLETSVYPQPDFVQTKKEPLSCILRNRFQKSARRCFYKSISQLVVKLVSQLNFLNVSSFFL